MYYFKNEKRRGKKKYLVNNSYSDVMIDDWLFEISSDLEPRYLTAFERVNSGYDVASVLSQVEQFWKILLESSIFICTFSG